MKRNFTLSLALVLSASAFAQTTLWDGENSELGSRGGCWDDGQPVVVENPVRDGINTSEKCLKFTMTNDSKVVKIPFREWITPAMDGSCRVSLMIRKAQNENLKVELSDPTDGSEGYWKNVAAWYGGDGEWQKVVLDYSANGAFDRPGIMTITAQTGDVDGEQEVYIDNVVIEPATRVNGMLLTEVADGSLTGNVTLSGAWMRGDCQMADGDWTANVYDDFSRLAGKLSAGVTSVDMRGTVLKEAYNAFGDVNPNIVVLADEAVDGGNVVVGGKTERLTLSQDYAFGIPVGFDAAEIEMARPLYGGYNTVYLPFFVSAEDLGAKQLATFGAVADNEGQVAVSFNVAGYAEANTPLLVDMENAAEVLKFYNKYVTELPADAAQGQFRGVYAPQSAAGLWGVADNNMFVQGNAEAVITAFHAYLELPATAKTVSFSTTTDGIAGVAAEQSAEDGAVYTLSGVKVAGSVKDAASLEKGIYVFNGKKFVVK